MSLNSVKQELSKIAPDLKIIEFDKSTASVEEAALAHEVEPGKIVNPNLSHNYKILYEKNKNIIDYYLIFCVNQFICKYVYSSYFK